MSSSSRAPLPNPSVHISDPKLDTFLESPDSELPPTISRHGAAFRLAYSATHPISLATDIPAHQSRVATHASDDGPLKLVPEVNGPRARESGGATNVWYIDMPPGSESPMHRWASVDVVVVVQGRGEVVMGGERGGSEGEGEGGEGEGERRVVSVGDMVVLRGSRQMWRNPSETEWLRLVSVVMSLNQEGEGKM